MPRPVMVAAVDELSLVSRMVTVEPLTVYVPVSIDSSSVTTPPSVSRKLVR